MNLNSRELFDMKGNHNENSWYCVDDHARAYNLGRYIASQWQMTRNSKLNNVYTGTLCPPPSPITLQKHIIAEKNNQQASDLLTKTKTSIQVPRRGTKMQKKKKKITQIKR